MKTYSDENTTQVTFLHVPTFYLMTLLPLRLGLQNIAQLNDAIFCGQAGDAETKQSCHVARCGLQFLWEYIILGYKSYFKDCVLKARPSLCHSKTWC